MTGEISTNNKRRLEQLPKNWHITYSQDGTGRCVVTLSNKSVKFQGVSENSYNAALTEVLDQFDKA